MASFYYHDTRNSIILRCNSALFLNTGTKNGPKPDSLMKYENRYRELLLFKQNLYCLCGFIKSYCTVIGKFNFVGKQTRNTDKRIEVTEKPKVFLGIKIITPIKDVAICVKHSTFQVNDFETIVFFKNILCRLICWTAKESYLFTDWGYLFQVFLNEPLFTMFFFPFTLNLMRFDSRHCFVNWFLLSFSMAVFFNFYWAASCVEPFYIFTTPLTINKTLSF